MASDQRKMELRRRWAEIMPAITSRAKRNANGEGSWVCPLCEHGSGTNKGKNGKNGDGLTFVPAGKYGSDGNILHCFGCGFTGDILSLISKVDNVDFPTAVAKAENILGLSPETTTGAAWKPQERKTTVPAITTPPKETAPQAPLNAPQEGKNPNADYLEECHKRLIEDPNSQPCRTYLAGRGLSWKLAAEYGCGYDPNHRRTGRSLIIPCSTGYVARSIESSDTSGYIRYSNASGSSAGLFNQDELYKAGPVFITEGAIDALSIIAAGGRAVGLNSTSGKSKLIAVIEEKPPKCFPVLCLDRNEEKNQGKNAERDIADALKAMKINFTTADLCRDDTDETGKLLKDPNDALCYIEESMKQRMQEAASKWSPRPDCTADYIKSRMGKEIETFNSAGERKTGFSKLDEEAGGIYNGLYVIAAGSSTGKTTAMLQLADQMATLGQDVLYFSMEQSRLEMVSKSIARFAAQDNIDTAVTSLSIRKGNNSAAVQRAISRYTQAVGDRVSIIEGDFMQSVSDIRRRVQKFIDSTGSHPVVIVDYLQLLQPDEDKQRQTTKEVMDNAVTQLKRMSRNLEVPVFAISSINRKSYYNPISFESLKESGGIEFTADVIWGLQFQIVSTPEWMKSEKVTPEKVAAITAEKEADTRKLDLVCVKNRYGKATFSVPFDYYPAHDLFVTG